ncbi:MAG: (d)CMP kinase, partial [Gemmatimonadota bacterium]
LEARDRADSMRRLSPLRAAPDAVRIDTTRLGPDAVVERVLALCRARDIGPAAPPGKGIAADDPVG